MNEFRKAIEAHLTHKMLEMGHGETLGELGALGSSLQDDLMAAAYGDGLGELGFSLKKIRKKIHKAVKKTIKAPLKITKKVTKAHIKLAKSKPKLLKKAIFATQKLSPAHRLLDPRMKKKKSPRIAPKPAPSTAAEFLKRNAIAQGQGQPYFTDQGLVDPSRPGVAPVPLTPPVQVPAAALPPLPVINAPSGWVPPGSSGPGWQPDAYGDEFAPGDEGAADTLPPAWGADEIAEEWTPPTEAGAEAWPDVEPGAADMDQEPPDFSSEWFGAEGEWTPPEMEPAPEYEEQPQYAWDEGQPSIDGLDGFFSKIKKAVSKVHSKVKKASKKAFHVLDTPRKKLLKAVGFKTPKGIKKIEREVKRVGHQIDKKKGVIIAVAAAVVATIYAGPQVGAAIMKGAGIAKGAVVAAAGKLGLGTAGAAAAKALSTAGTPAAGAVTQAANLTQQAGFWSKVGSVAKGALDVSQDMLPLVDAGLQIDAAKFQQKMALAQAKAEAGQPWESTTSWEDDYNAPGLAEQQLIQNAGGPQQQGGGLAKFAVPAAIAAISLLT